MIDDRPPTTAKERAVDRPTRATRTPTFLCCAMFALAASAPAQRPEPDPAELASDAERALNTGAKEDAVVFASAARARLTEVADRTQRELLRRGIDSILSRADLRASIRRERDGTEAKELVELARGYLRRKLPQRAVALLTEALELDRVTVEPVLAYAQKQLVSRAENRSDPTPSKPKARTGESKESKLRDRIGDIVPRTAWGTWDLQNSEVRSPRLEGNTVYLIAKEPRHEDHRLSVDLLIGDLDGSGALVFGGIDASTYYILELLHQTDEGTGRYSNLSIHRIEDAKAIELARIAFDLTPAQRAGWLTISVSIRGRELTAGLRGQASLRCTAPTAPHGGVGFFVTGNSPNPAPVGFRRLLIEELPAEAGGGVATPDDVGTDAVATAAPGQDPVANAVRLILDAGPHGDVDSHLRALYELIPRLPEIRDDGEATALALRLLGVLDALDPLARQDRELRGTRAGRRVADARAYLDAHWLRLAKSSLDEAARFDLAAGWDLRAELASALAPRSPSLLPEALDCEVLRWFDGGETLLGQAGWVLGPKGARTPTASGGEEQLLASRAAQPTNGTLRTDLVLPASPEARVGLAFELRSPHDLSFAIVDRDKDRLRLSVVRYYAGNYTVFGTRLGANAPRDETTPAHLEIDLRDGTARVTLTGAEPLELKLADRAARPRIGLFASVPGEAGEFRNFRVESRED